jgi:hypothetical protein
MSYWLSALVIVDGIVTRNDHAWAGLPRALMVLSVVAVAVLELYRSGVRLDAPAAVIVGIVGAMVVAASYRATLDGLALWLVYLGAFVLARSVQRDWLGDVARAGALIAVFELLLRIMPPPEGAWNSNVIGAVLVVCLAASFGWEAAPEWHRLKRWGVSLAILIGICATGSRGAMAGAFVSACVMFFPRALVTVPALAGALIVMRPYQSAVRIEYWSNGVRAWLDNFAFGLGPGRLEFQVLDHGRWLMMHAHNAYISLAAQIGLIGLVVLAAFCVVTARVNLGRAAIAALAGVAVHSIVDDPLLALPVGLMLCLCLVESRDASISHILSSVTGDMSSV